MKQNEYIPRAYSTLIDFIAANVCINAVDEHIVGIQVQYSKHTDF